MSEHEERRETVAQIRADAQRWYDRQVEVLQSSLRRHWALHEAWVRNYLKAELRQRLIARGWRLRDGQ
jgi:hypothetical protein